MPTSFANPAVTDPAISVTNNRINATGFLYDSAGNTVRDGDYQTFLYDAENKQREVKNSSSVSLGQYWYDGDGKRVKKIGINPNGQPETTIFVYDAAGKQIAEYSTVVAAGSAAKVNYITNDHLGSPRINTDQNGVIISRHDYHPFGEEIDGTGGRTVGLSYGDDTVRKQFTGYERDSETELDFAQARMYASKLGRFSTADPLYILRGRLNDPQQLNLYSYVRNNPLRLSDPTGLDPDVQLTGIGTDKMVEDLNKRPKGQFKVEVNANGFLEIADKNKIDVTKLNKRERVLYDAIVDTTSHAVLNGVEQSDEIDFGQFKGNGRNNIDTADMKLLRGASKAAAGEAMSHEIVEASESAKGSCTNFSSCHKKASSAFPEPEGSNISYQKLSGDPTISTYTENLKFRTAGVSVKITYQLTTPVPKSSLSGTIPLANITKIQ